MDHTNYIIFFGNYLIFFCSDVQLWERVKIAEDDKGVNKNGAVRAATIKIADE